MKAILILAHGSRERKTLETLHKITDMTKAQLPGVMIETAYMEFCDINLEKGLDMLIKKGADNITVVPYFLFEGIHIREDIPGEIKEYIEKHPGIKVTLGNTLGADPRLADVLADRIREAL
ncbi:sirohydrochlorin chelatase [Ruminiclostridium papyrosolvens]|uniref:Cobalamin biosynthesis protein CbiX n=1 Tax=Ruminiclostridium papyrosolvens C7 TaxID=1330534 RepID=U4QZB4_9FIRM|nr:CbiX/SirB N-terminal domain-containing protein [Ruminiclostridium papyrosolvens]EPR09340.1 cobalamin biosynthesis protein CbiX [Ruminiclostridium papyrosolvens C7]